MPLIATPVGMLEAFARGPATLSRVDPSDVHDARVRLAKAGFMDWHHFFGWHVTEKGFDVIREEKKRRAALEAAQAGA